MTHRKVGHHIGTSSGKEKVGGIHGAHHRQKVRPKGQVGRVHQLLLRRGKGDATSRQVRHRQLGRRHITLNCQNIGAQLLHEQVRTHIKGVHRGNVGNTHIGNSDKRRGGIDKLHHIRGSIPNV